MERKIFKSLVFICREDSGRWGILLFPDRPRVCRLMKTCNRKYPRSSGMVWDESGEPGAFLFSRRDPDFCNGRRSFPTNENFNLYGQGRRRWISLITNPLNCWAPVPQSHINMAPLGQTSSDYPIYRQILERSAKSKIPDSLGLSLHMKTRLYDQGRIALRLQSSRDKIINSLRSRPLFSWQARSFFQILKERKNARVDKSRIIWFKNMNSFLYIVQFVKNWGGGKSAVKVTQVWRNLCHCIFWMY